MNIAMIFLPQTISMEISNLSISVESKQLNASASLSVNSIANKKNDDRAI